MPRGEMTLRGKHAFEVLRRLHPVLNGKNTLDAILSGLPKPARSRVLQIVTTLGQHGFVRDASKDRAHGLPHEVEVRFESTIEVLDNLMGSGCANFERFCNASIVCCGDTRVSKAIADALKEGGASNVSVAEDPGFERVIPNAVTSNGRQDSTAYPIILDQIASGHDYLLLSHFGYDEQWLNLVEEWCRQASVIVLPIILGESNGIVGPFLGRECGTSCNGILARRNVSTIPLMPHDLISPLALSIVSHIATSELVIHAASPRHAQLSDRIFHLKYENLEGTLRSVFPSPLSNASNDATYSEFAGGPAIATADDSDVAFNAKLQCLVDSDFGVLHELGVPEFCTQSAMTTCAVFPAEPTATGFRAFQQPLYAAAESARAAADGAVSLGIETYVRSLLRQFPERGVTMVGRSLASNARQAFEIADLPSNLVVSAASDAAVVTTAGLSRMLAAELVSESIPGVASSFGSHEEWMCSDLSVSPITEALMADLCNLKIICTSTEDVHLASVFTSEGANKRIGFSVAHDRTVAIRWALLDAACRHFSTPQRVFSPVFHYPEITKSELSKMIRASSKLFSDRAAYEVELDIDESVSAQGYVTRGYCFLPDGS